MGQQALVMVMVLAVLVWELDQEPALVKMM